MTEKNSKSKGSPGAMPPLVLILWMAALKWLVLGLAVGFVASMKMHATALFADIPFLTYGVLMEVSETILLYGFVLQSVFAGCIWAASRLHDIRPGIGHVSFVGVFIWNPLLLIGCIQIFLHGTSGLKFMSLSPSVLLGLTLASLFIVLPWVSRLLSHHSSDKVAPAYLLLSLLIFPMIALPGGHFLHSAGIQGVMQNVIALWFGHTLIFTMIPVFLLGILLYFVEEESAVKGYSKSVPTATLWCILLGGFLGGLYHGFPLGGAVNSLSVASTWFPAFGCFALFLTLFNLANENKNAESVLNTFGLKWIAGGVMLVLSLNAISQLRGFSGGFGLTTLKPGFEQFLVLGCLLMGVLFLIQFGNQSNFKPSAPICFAIYFGSLICLTSFAIEAVLGNASGLRMHVVGYLVLLLVSLSLFISLTSTGLRLAIGAVTGCCAPAAKPVEKSKLVNA
jgi:cbb3-type cytochrome oxidase subunit 1